MSARKSLAGIRFGKLVVIQDGDAYVSPKGGRYGRSICLCDCGSKKIVRHDDLKNGRVKSCGCAPRGKITHGHAKRNSLTRTYRSWANMLSRCTNPKNTHFEIYGARGITVCERWNSFQNFLKDMGEAPAGFTIERKDNNKGYEPENCAWIPKGDQAKNRRYCIVFSHDGFTGCLKDVCRRFGFNYQRAINRIHLGWSVKDAVFCPVIRRALH